MKDVAVGRIRQRGRKAEGQKDRKTARTITPSRSYGR